MRITFKQILPISLLILGLFYSSHAFSDDALTEDDYVKLFDKNVEVGRPLRGLTMMNYKGVYLAGFHILELELIDSVRKKDKKHPADQLRTKKNSYRYGMHEFKTKKGRAGFLIHLSENGTKGFKPLPKKKSAETAKAEIDIYNKELFDLFGEQKGATDKRKAEIEKKLKELQAKIGRVIAEIEPGQAVGVIGGKIDVLTKSNRAKIMVRFHEPTAKRLQWVASTAKGILGFSGDAGQLTKVINLIFENILHNANTDRPLDILFVVDSTGSMKDDILDVAKNGVSIVNKLEEFSKTGLDIHVAVAEYNDVSRGTYPYPGTKQLYRINRKLSNDFAASRKAFGKIRAFAGGDHPEAMIEILRACTPAKTGCELNWRDDEDKRLFSQKRIILITDAPPHEKSHDGKDTFEDVIKKLAQATDMKIFPILVDK
jgi:hypothetical protein